MPPGPTSGSWPRPPTTSTRARALWGLARAYEAQKLWAPGPGRLSPGHEAIRRPVDPRRPPGARQPWDAWSPTGSARSRSVAGWSATTLRAERPDVPLRRRWDRRWSATGPAARGRRRPPFGRGRRGSSWSRGERSGRSTRRLGRIGLVPRPRRRAVWVGYLADRIIAATRTRLVALSLDKGLVEWQYDLGVGPADPGRRHQPVRPRAGRPNRAATPSTATLQGLPDRRQPGLLPPGRPGPDGLRRRLRPARLVVHAPAGRINPTSWSAPGGSSSRSASPTPMLVLDTANGRRRASSPRPTRKNGPATPCRSTTTTSPW